MITTTLLSHCLFMIIFRLCKRRGVTSSSRSLQRAKLSCKLEEETGNGTFEYVNAKAELSPFFLQPNPTQPPGLCPLQKQLWRRRRDDKGHLHTSSVSVRFNQSLSPFIFHVFLAPLNKISETVQVQVDIKSPPSTIDSILYNRRSR